MGFDARERTGRMAWFSLCLASIMMAGCATTDERQAQARRRDAGEREHRKQATGLSFAAETDVALLPLESLSASGFDEERVWSGADDWEPHVAADRTSSYVYQLTTRFFGSRVVIVFRRSPDGGATWEQDKQLTFTHRPQYDPQIRVDGTGKIHACWLDNWDTLYVQSSDHGETWSEPIVIAAEPYTDHGWLAVSDDGQDVYIGFNAADSYVAASHDGGVTFSAPVKTNSDDRYWFHTGGAVAPNGDVWFACANYRLASYLGNTHVYAIRSTDGGATWDERRLDTSRVPPPCNWAPGCVWGWYGPTAGLAVDAAGSVMIAYNAGRTPEEPHQMWVQTTTDGEHWSGPRRISIPSPEAWNAFPAVEAGPAAGDFRVVWQGTADANIEGWNTYYRRTTDGGQTWGPIVRLSDRPDGAPYKNEDGYLFTYGDYLGLSVDGEGVNHVIWGEGLSYWGPGGTWYTRGVEGD